MRRTAAATTSFIGIVVLMVLAVLLVVVGAATPAAACSCAATTDSAAFTASDAVFTGRVKKVLTPERTGSSLDPAVWVFKVDRVYKGQVARRQRITTPVSGASCGLETRGPGRLLVFAGGVTGGPLPNPDPGSKLYKAGLCGGTRLAAQQPIPAGFGAGSRPTK